MSSAARVNRIALREDALAIALSQVGVKEEGGRNRGPQVEKYLAAVGLPPGHHWCAAFIVYCYLEAWRRHFNGGSIPKLPLRRTGKVIQLWRYADAGWKSNLPSVGAIYCHANNPKDPESSGHCGIVTKIEGEMILGVEGNTNTRGSPVGDRVRINRRPLGYVNLGFIDVGREGPAEPRVVLTS